MTLPERIKQKRREKKLTQEKLAKLVGITQQAMQRIEDGSTQKPKDLVLIAKHLGCSAEWLLFGPPSQIREPNQHYKKQAQDDAISASLNAAPIISYLQAAHWKGVDDLTDKQTQWQETPTTASSNAFWLRVIGNSMTCASGTSIPEGYLILVEPDLTAKNGDLVVAKLTASEEVTFKQLSIDAGNTYLRPLNSDYRPIEIDDSTKIIGVVTQATLTF